MRPITLLLLMIGFLGCSKSPHGEPSSGAPSDKSLAYVLSDRSHPEFERVYYFDGRSVVAQKHIFPGYANRQAYVCATLPPDIRKELLRWTSHQGEVTPPFEPGGVWYSITSFVEGKRNSTAYFDDANADVGRFFTTLQSSCMTTSNQVQQLPDSILSNSAVRKFYGLYE